MPLAVAFFRNLNLGQGWSPTRPQLVAAYERAGATYVDNVQSNGTLIVLAPDPVAATRAVLAEVREVSGYADIAVVRSASFVREVAARLAGLAVPDDVPVEVLVYDARRPFPHPLPWTTSDGQVEVLHADRRHAITAFHQQGLGGSPAGRVLPELVGVPVTARGAGTLLRVAARLDRAPRTPGG
jgi:hypothetical protein